ncbi:MAG: phytanoyl-CoA dioxygenase family protein [Moorea sp. SIO2I5]|nr:phytanoyl-CoA dioxygenase family protein [Moorena sp. SIO2I5]
MKLSSTLHLSTPELLNGEQISAFTKDGYLILPSFLSPSLVTTLKEEVDYWVDQGLRAQSIEYCCQMRRDKPPVIEMELGEHGWLISYPPLMAILTQLMGAKFAFHHLHSSRSDAGAPDKNWHHDYEQYPQTNRYQTMIHVFHYLDGLNGTIGDLVLLPGSQRIVAEKNAFGGFGAKPLPGELVIENLPLGSTVIINSALFHTRRAKPGGEGNPRYLVDCSYCQAGVRWPVVKPYWRQMLACARDLGLARDQWHDLFSEKHFYDPYGFMAAFKEINRGSLMEQLMPDCLETTTEMSRNSQPGDP